MNWIKIEDGAEMPETNRGMLLWFGENDIESGFWYNGNFCINYVGKSTEPPKFYMYSDTLPQPPKR